MKYNIVQQLRLLLWRNPNASTVRTAGTFPSWTAPSSSE